MRRFTSKTMSVMTASSSSSVVFVVRRLQIGADEEDRLVMAAQREEFLKRHAAAEQSSLQPQPGAATTVPRPWASSQVAVEDNTDEVIIANQALIAYEEEAQATRDELSVPRHPDELVPYYARVNKHQKLKFLDHDDPDKVHMKAALTLPPPPKQHPWIESQPIGPHILHGDGQLGTHGDGNVGFDEGQVWKEVPKHYRGVNYNTNLGLQLPQTRGYVNPDTIVKHSLNLTGKGIFATHPIKKGDLIMLVRSTATDLGFNSYTDRLVYMVRDILLEAHSKRKDPEFMDYLHTWICCGQQSSRVEYWPRDATERVVKIIGGPQILADLELHEHHVARIAAIVELNSFVVEGFYNEDKGKGYWPEAGLLNHSCIPNADYGIMTVDDFVVSDYNPEIAKHKAEVEKEEKDTAAATAAGATPKTSPDHVHHEGCGCPGHEAPSGKSTAGAAAASAKKAAEGASSDLTRLIKAFAKSDVTTAHAEMSAYQEAKRHDSFVDKTVPGSGEVDASPRGNKTVTPSPDDVEALEELKERNPAAELAPSRLQRLQQAKFTGHHRVVDVLETAESEVDRAQAEADAEALLGYRRNDYVFACRANRDIAAGEEVLIAYVPPEWRFDYRQYVLHDRYRFWCRCPKCTPPVEYRAKGGPRFMLFIIMVYFVAQLALYAAQTDTLDMHAAIERGEDTVHEKRFYT